MFSEIGSFGPVFCLGLAVVGSTIGCGLAGMTSHGVMPKTDEGHGLFVALSAMPAGQTIYGFVLTILMSDKINLLMEAGKSTVPIFAIGLTCGLALMLSAIYQGKACSSAILAVAKKPSIAGMSFAAPGIIESFAIFAMVGGILLLQGIKV